MRRPVLVASLVAVALLAGCSGGLPSPGSEPPAPTASAPLLPPRPSEIRLDGLDPCTALTPDQRTRLDIGSPVPEPDAPGGASCQWIHSPDEPLEGYLIQHGTDYRAERALRAVRGASVVSVAGFPAVRTRLDRVSPERNCVLFVDVAGGQSLFVHYIYDGYDLPMTEELACEKVHAAAELAMQTLIAQVEG